MKTLVINIAVMVVVAIISNRDHPALAANTKPPAETVSPTYVKRAADLVTTGKVYSLAVTTGPDTPMYPGRSFSMHVMPVFENDQRVVGKNRLTGHDDMVCTSLGIGTQIDGLGHVGIEGVHFGGAKASDFWRPSGLKRFGMETLKPIVTRGILIDIEALDGKPTAPNRAITAADIRAALNRQKIKIASGDVVLIHTGWLRQSTENPNAFISSEPGLTMDGAEYLANKGVIAVGADNWGLEVVPSIDPENVFPVHQFLLAQKGIYILENIDTLELMADQVYEFLFVLSAPKLKGAVQGIVHPVAIR